MQPASQETDQLNLHLICKQFNVLRVLRYIARDERYNTCNPVECDHATIAWHASWKRCVKELLPFKVTCKKCGIVVEVEMIDRQLCLSERAAGKDYKSYNGTGIVPENVGNDSNVVDILNCKSGKTKEQLMFGNANLI